MSLATKASLFFIGLLLPLLGLGQDCTGLGSQQFSDIIHVSVTGTSSGAATEADPVDLLTGMSMLGGNADKIYLQGGTYVLTEPLFIPSNIDLIGGYNANWIKDNTSITTLFRDPSNVELGPPRLIALLCVGQSNFRIQDVTIRTANALGQGVSTYGVYLNNCSDYEIVRCKIVAGNGGNGSPGAPGVPGPNGTVGENGKNGEEDSSGNRGGGAGACCSFPGSNRGGDGGFGGERGTYQFPAGGDAFPGYTGGAGQGTGGGYGGPTCRFT